MCRFGADPTSSFSHVRLCRLKTAFTSCQVSFGAVCNYSVRHGPSSTSSLSEHGRAPPWPPRACPQRPFRSHLQPQINGSRPSATGQLALLARHLQRFWPSRIDGTPSVHTVVLKSQEHPGKLPGCGNSCSDGNNPSDTRPPSSRRILAREVMCKSPRNLKI